MTDPSPPAVPSPRSDWLLRIFAALVAFTAGFGVFTAMEDLIRRDIWKAAAVALGGGVTALYWAGLAVLPAARLRAARARFTTAHPASFARAIGCVLLCSASFAAWFLIPDAYEGILFFAIVATYFAAIGYQVLRRKPASDRFRPSVFSASSASRRFVLSSFA